MQKKIGTYFDSNCFNFINSISIIVEWHRHHIILVNDKPWTAFRKHNPEMLFLYDGLIQAMSTVRNTDEIYFM